MIEPTVESVFQRLEAIYGILATPGDGYREALLKERDALLACLCDRYLQSTPRQRGKIRGFFRGKRRAKGDLAAVAVKHSYRAKKDPQVHAVRLAIAAVSIADEDGEDPRDGSILEHIYRCAQEAGIDPRPLFRDVADLSSKSHTGLCPGTMSRYMARWSERHDD
jgi:hypothetical protein